MKPINECKTVAELLEDPKRWTQFVHARNEARDPVSYDSEDACCFCLLGAINKVYSAKVRYEIADRLKVSMSIGLIHRYNDSDYRTHAEVLEAVRKAGI